MQNSGTIEARLFYNGTSQGALETLAGKLVAAFADTSIKIRPRLIGDSDLAFAVGGLTLTVSHLAERMNVDDMAGCRRPGHPLMTRQDAWNGLRQHEAAMIIRISGPDYAATKQTRLGICFIAAMQAVKLAEPDFLHWGNSNILYSGQEYLAIAKSDTTTPANTVATSDEARQVPSAHSRPNAWMARSYRAHACSEAAIRPVSASPRHETTSSTDHKSPTHGAASSQHNAPLRERIVGQQRSARPMLQDLLNSLRAA